MCIECTFIILDKELMKKGEDHTEEMEIEGNCICIYICVLCMFVLLVNM